MQVETSKQVNIAMKTNKLRVWLAVCVSALTATTTLRASADQMGTAARPEKIYTGTVTAVDTKEHMLSVKKWAVLNKKFNLGDGCAYTFVENGAGTISNLRPGQRVRVGYKDAHGVLVAESVSQQPMRYEGMVKAIDLTQHTLLLHVHGLDKTIQIANDCDVLLRDEKSGVLGDIQAGNYVTVTYEVPEGTPTARQIAQTSATFSGSLTAIDLETKTVKARQLFEVKTFKVGDDCAIIINGKPDGQLGDLRPNDKLVFSYDDLDGVNIVNRIAPSEPSSKNVVASGPPSGN